MAERRNLPNTVSIVKYNNDGRLTAPAAARNAKPIIQLVRKTVTKPGNALEIASGTGQHIVKLASALPFLNWQPSDVDITRLNSIQSWSNDQNLKNLRPPCILDATEEGWSEKHRDQDLILLVNLLHLISIKETKILVKEGFKVMVYCTDDPLLAKKLEENGASAIMPLASPIGSGLGIQNKINISLIIKKAKVPVIVDAGIGTASDATVAMELGCDGVLINSAIAMARDPTMMAKSFKHAVKAGRKSFLAGRMKKNFFGIASSPKKGLI